MVSVTHSHTVSVDLYNLEATLRSGQSFSWQPQLGGKWRGWVAGQPVVARQEGNLLHLEGSAAAHELERYFQWSVDLVALRRTFPDDPHTRAAWKFCRGMRVLRQDPWETTANFICSAQKQVAQIEQINANVRRALGREHAEGMFTYPTAQEVAQAGEAALRQCKLGYRATHLIRAARQVADGEVDLAAIEKLETPRAREELMRLRGVGEKVANCILLFAYGRWEAFPIDVWIERVLRLLYFPRKRKVTARFMRDFAADYFGPNGGYIQQYLFHWVRHTLPRGNPKRQIPNRDRKRKKFLTEFTE
jgi:N-glycosylase/DNA lyase